MIGAAAGAFVGIAFALAFLIAGLLDLIGIRAISELLREGWFAWGLAGAAFGGAVGLLREYVADGYTVVASVADGTVVTADDIVIV